MDVSHETYLSVRKERLFNVLVDKLNRSVYNYK